MKSAFVPGVCLPLLFAAATVAAEYRVETLSEAPPADAIAADVAAQLESNGARIVRGESTTYCDIWLCKELAVTADFQPSSELLYPFRQGQLIGVARFARKGADFRDQDIASGVYTMRFALQPTDGAHEGTSVTRDFLLLLRAEDDEEVANLEDEDELNELSMDAVESAHPGMLALQSVEGDAQTIPAMRHDEEHDFWIARLRVKTVAGDKKKDLDLDLVVVGIAEE